MPESSEIGSNSMWPEKIETHEIDGVMLEIAMALAKEEKEPMTYKTEMYLAWLAKREALADTDNESQDRDKARLELDLDRLEILILAGFIEQAKEVATELTEAIEAARYEDLFDRLFELKEGLSSKILPLK